MDHNRRQGLPFGLKARSLPTSAPNYHRRSQSSAGRYEERATKHHSSTRWIRPIHCHPPDPIHDFCLQCHPPDRIRDFCLAFSRDRQHSEWDVEKRVLLSWASRHGCTTWHIRMFRRLEGRSRKGKILMLPAGNNSIWRYRSAIRSLLRAFLQHWQAVGHQAHLVLVTDASRTWVIEEDLGNTSALFEAYLTGAGGGWIGEKTGWLISICASQCSIGAVARWP